MIVVVASGAPPAEPAPVAAVPEPSAPAPAAAVPEPSAPEPAPAAAVPGPSAPDAPGPASAGAAPPEWVPPDTLNEKLSRWSRAAVKLAVTLLGLLLLATFVVWLVPAVVMSRSEAYRVAVEHTLNDPMLRDELGPPLQAAWAPERYRVHSPTHAEVIFEVRGATGWTELVGVEVMDGKVLRGPHRFLDYGD